MEIFVRARRLAGIGRELGFECSRFGIESLLLLLGTNL